ncbi:hypothetical protein GCM10022251_17280 [Phytohabitans flavus]|uniref:Uncharacterized protein n=1 Tax=Phytohabitans flavus TaxID=1076124 RepID=A0A6F8Y652_9ACTN|nr:hypothetical protein Pflav_079190 [Phytohabitans flavus]
MSANWRDVKAKARAHDPEWDSAERAGRRAQMRQEMLASLSGAQLAIHGRDGDVGGRLLESCRTRGLDSERGPARSGW